MKPNKLELSSVDGTQLNLEALYQIAPSCFTEVKDEKTGELHHVVNFKTLRQLLGDNAVEDADEMYQFTWPGKQEARREAARPTTKTLRPVIEDSVDWDHTQNLYIEGDNLEVLKLLQKSYMGKVKMIYIDPPYNTGNDFVYNDDFTRTKEEEDNATGNIDELGNRYRKNLETNGRFHSDWCSMIYPRLMIARSLLTEDGVIFISIDDNEVENLKKICNEIFGESNTLVNGIWVSGRTAASHFTNSHEYIIGYAKDLKNLPFFKYKGNDASISDRTIKKIGIKNPASEIDFPAGIDFESEDKVFPQFFGTSEIVEITKGVLECKDRKLKNPVRIKAGWAMRDMIINWINGKTVYDQKGQLIRRFYFKQNGVLQYEKSKGTIHPNSVITEFSTKQGSNIIEKLFGTSLFSYPKPIELIKYLSVMLEEDDILLDFFSGSSTSAHAVMQLNAEDKGNRKYIMVQLPEETPEDSEARKAGYNTIPEIAQERIRRAGKKIKEENKDKEGIENLDTGFRVFRLADSNFEEVKKAPAEYNQSQLDLFLNNIKSDRTDLDLLFGAMLSWGVQLSLPMASEEVDGKMIYTVNEGDLVACFAEDVTENIVKAMAAKQPLRVLFRDGCFVRDDAKINVFETLKQLLDWSEEEAMKNIKVI